MGFEHFYGFMGGDADQWTPGSLFRDTTHIEPFRGNPNWNLTTAMADDAIQWLNELNDGAGDERGPRPESSRKRSRRTR